MTIRPSQAEQWGQCTPTGRTVDKKTHKYKGDLQLHAYQAEILADFSGLERRVAGLPSYQGRKAHMELLGSPKETEELK